MVKIRWEIEERSQRAYLGSILITELWADPEDLRLRCSWTPHCMFVGDDQYYMSHNADNFWKAKADIEAYVATWLDAAGLVQREAA